MTLLQSKCTGCHHLPQTSSLSMNNRLKLFLHCARQAQRRRQHTCGRRAMRRIARHGEQGQCILASGGTFEVLLPVAENVVALQLGVLLA